MPLVSPGPREDEEEKPSPSPEQVFVAKTVQKGESFWHALRRAGGRIQNTHMPLGLKQLGHDIWYGTQQKKRPSYRPLNRWKWLWGSYKAKPRRFEQPYVAFKGLMRKRKR